MKTEPNQTELFAKFKITEPSYISLFGW